MSEPWFSPAGAAAADAAIADIAQALRRPPSLDHYDRNAYASLLSREPGMALFYAYLNEVAPRRAWPRLGVAMLERAIARVPHISYKPFFSYGFAGTAWAVQHLAGWFIEVSPHINDDIDRALLTLVEEAPTLSFDLQHGLVGFGVYAVERLPRRRARRLLEGIVDRLAQTAEPRHGGLAWRMVNADWVEGPGIASLDRGLYPLGVFNGVAGVVGLLGAVVQRRIATQTARRLLEGGLSFLWSSRRDGLFTDKRHLTWISGSLGIAAVAFAAARAVRGPEWERRFLNVARRLARGEGLSSMRDPTLVAGAAGAAHMFRRLHLATGEPCFAEAGRRWLARLLHCRRPGKGMAGYSVRIPLWERRYVGNPNHRVGWLGLPGLANGVAGVGLCLLSARRNQEPCWDRALLLSHRRQ